MANKLLSGAIEYPEAANLRISDLDALACLHEVGNRCVRTGDDFEGCLGAILEAAIFVTVADKGNIQLRDRETGVLVISTQRGFSEEFLAFFAQVDHETPAVCSEALRTSARVMVEDVARSELLSARGASYVLLAEGIRAVQSTPLVSSSGHVFGMISTHFTRPTHLGEREARFMDLLARQAADYVERKETERLLTAKRLQLERITAHVDSLIMQCSRDCRYVFVNKPCAEFFGKPIEQIVGHSIPEVIGEEAFQVIYPYIERVLSGERVEFETEILYAGPGSRQVHVVYVPDLDSRGAVCGWIATVNDITRRRQLAGQLRTADRPPYAQEVVELQVADMTRVLDDLV